MRQLRLRAVCVVVLAAALGIPAQAQRRQIAGFSLATAVARWDLPVHLREVSGLAPTTPGLVLAHDDESGRLTEIDYRRGTVVRELTVGSPLVAGDFEDIMVVGRRVTLMTSDGRLYSADLPSSGSQLAPVAIVDTRLAQLCEFEGLARDADGAWLLPCKSPRRYAAGRELFSIFAWAPSGPTPRRPRYTIPRGRQRQPLRPSAIAVTAGGTFVVLFGPEHAIGEFSRSGATLALFELDARAHPRPEGLAITPDGFLLIADEAVTARGKGTLTVYGASPAR